MPSRANGSLFSDANPGFLEDTRAVRVGDFVVININENANAQGDTTTNLSKQHEQQHERRRPHGPLAGAEGRRVDDEPDAALQLREPGRLRRLRHHRAVSGQLNGSIAVRVTREMPNGDLLLEGTKVVLINNEEYHLYVSGLVRPADIAQDNSIASTRIADAQIEFTGRGDLADQQRKGWLARILDVLNPF